MHCIQACAAKGDYGNGDGTSLFDRCNEQP